MKRNLYLFIGVSFLLCISSFTKAQEFTLDEYGFKNSDIPDQKYIVIEFPGSSQSELFKKTELFLSDLMYHPDASLNKLDSSLIKISGFQDDIIRRNNFHVFDLRYNLTFKFKQGKMRIDAPSVEMTTFVNHHQELFIKANNNLNGSRLGIYNNAGQLKSKLAKQDLEAFFNKIIKDISEYLSSNAKSDW